jgi:aminopeptidase N
MVAWDGETGVCSTTIDFEPVAVFCDYNNKFADASIEKTYIIKNTGSHNFGEAKFKATVQEISDSTLLRVEHHWTGPKTNHELPEGLTLSSNRYWTIHILDKGESKIQGEFQYQKNANYDDDIMVNENDSIVLLYRPNGSEMWQSLNYVHQAQNNFGRMTVDDIKSGDYTLGMWDEEHASVKEINNENGFEIFPNPAKNKINIRMEKKVNDNIIMTNQAGQVVKEIAINGKEATIEIDDLASGVYNLRLKNSENQKSSRVVKL